MGRAGVEVTESSVLVLPFTASSVGVARRHLVSDLIEAGVCASAVTDAALVISELLSNALRHAGPLPGSGIRVAWDLDADSVRISVSDGGGPSRPEFGEPTPTTTGGRGLRIVARLSRRWGTLCDDDGTTVWAEVLVMPLETVAVPAVAAESGGLTGGARGVVLQWEQSGGVPGVSSPVGQSAGSARGQVTLSLCTTQPPGFRTRGTVGFGSWSLMSRVDFTMITRS
jgi:anti-sigma regulatory factor (Ser/Thr protein kinase)